jgi:Domain of unknown function (DUF6894)
MPRFFFHLRKRDCELTDPVGVVLSDVTTARAQAIKSVRDFFQPFRGSVDPEWKNWSLAVSDDQGRCVFAMDFAAASAMQPDDAPATTSAGSQIVRLDLERMRRKLSGLMNHIQELFDRKAVLVDQSRYEIANLRRQLKVSEIVRDQARDVLMRSRQQSQASPYSVGGADADCRPRRRRMDA